MFLKSSSPTPGPSAKRVGNIRLTKACKRAHEIGYYNYKIIEDILKNNLDKYDEDVQPGRIFWRVFLFCGMGLALLLLVAQPIFYYA